MEKEKPNSRREFGFSGEKREEIKRNLQCISYANFPNKQITVLFQYVTKQTLKKTKSNIRRKYKFLNLYRQKNKTNLHSERNNRMIEVELF